MNSVQKSITQYTIANDIRQRRQVTPEKTFIVVEGTSDHKIFTKLFDVAKCAILAAGGKSMVTKTLDILDADAVRGVLGIVDNDFDFFLGRSYSSTNVVNTFVHDTEVMMFLSDAFNALLAEFGNEERIGNFCNKVHLLREKLIELPGPLGYARLASLRAKKNILFEGLNFKFFNEDLTTDLPNLISTLISRTKDCNSSISEFTALLSAEMNNDVAMEHLCCGHDLCEVLARAFRDAIGRNKSGIGAADVERALRLSFTLQDFEKTKLFESIADWSSRNPSCLLLRAKS